MARGGLARYLALRQRGVVGDRLHVFNAAGEPQLKNGWKADSYYPPYFFKDPSGFVWLFGTVTHSVPYTTGTLGPHAIATLLVRYRPEVIEQFLSTRSFVRGFEMRPNGDLWNPGQEYDESTGNISLTFGTRRWRAV